MSKDEIKNPYLSGASPDDMDYMLILEEQRAKREREELRPGKQAMEFSRSLLGLPELHRPPKRDNRFKLDIVKDVKQNVDISHLNKDEDKYSRNYRPKPEKSDSRRMYEALSEKDKVSPEDVRSLYSGDYKRRLPERASPVKRPERSVEERRAELDAMLPDMSAHTLEAIRREKEKPKLPTVPSFMRDGSMPAAQAEPPSDMLEDFPLPTALKTQNLPPGFEYRTRYMHQTLNPEEERYRPPERAGFGGNSARPPNFESETQVWSNRVDEELFAPIEQKFQSIVPMRPPKANKPAKKLLPNGVYQKSIEEEVGARPRPKTKQELMAEAHAQKRKNREERRNTMRAQSPIPSDNAAKRAYRTGRTNADILAARQAEAERIAAEDLAKKHAEIARALSIMEQVGSGNAAEVQPESAEAPTAAANEPSFIESFDAEYEAAQAVQVQPAAPIAPIEEELDADEEHFNSMGGRFDRRKSTYSYLFDESQPMPDTFSDYAKIRTHEHMQEQAQESSSPYGYLYMDDEEINRQTGFAAEELTVEDEPNGSVPPSLYVRGGMSPITEELDAEDEAPSLRHGAKKQGGFGRIAEEDENIIPEFPENTEAPPYPEDTGEALAETQEDSVPFGEHLKSFFKLLSETAVSAVQQLKLSVNKPDFSREYEQSSQGEAVREELYDKLSGSIFKMISIFAAFLILAVPELLLACGVHISAFSSDMPVVYYGICLIVTIYTLIICHKSILGGLKGLFKGRISGDFTYGFATIAILLQNVAMMFSEGQTFTRSYTLILVIAFFLNELGRFLHTVRLGRNFSFVTGKSKKGAMILADAEGEQLSAVLGKRDTRTSLFVKAGFFSGFLGFSYEDDPSEFTAKKTAPFLAAASILIAAAAGFLGGSFFTGVGALAAAAVISLPLMRSISVNVPLAKSTKKLLKKGVMLSGWAAVDEFSEVNVLTIEENQLFPASRLELVGVKVFSEQRIDRLILEAAAVTMECGGSISKIFETIIKDGKNNLPHVEQVEYQPEMGFCGWVNNRRILVGNIDLMREYGVTPPNRNYERIYEKEGSNLLYLSADGVLCAMFVLKYHAERASAIALRKLERAGVKFVVRSLDFNINPIMISRKFGISKASVKVLPVYMNPIYNKIAGEERREAPAVLVTGCGLSAFALGLLETIKLKGSIAMAVILQTIGVILGFVSVGLISCLLVDFSLSPAYVFIYELFWAVLVLAVGRMRR
ncbi:MAG: hypothetical protein LBS74_03200 [Oscillospiraceae bacterium]|jgi:Cu+-exporting ATPase|nr:hypothetical protein [Oscillospiraceae bacterium]